MRRLFSRESRQTLIYIMLMVWIAFGVTGFIMDSNFMDLATYYGTFSGPAMMYIWGETKRPHDRTISSD